MTDFYGGSELTYEYSGGSIMAGGYKIESTSMMRNFEGGGKTYNNFWGNGATDNAKYYILGSNTFNDFKISNPQHEIHFENGKTTTVTTFTVSGIIGAGKTMLIDSVDGINQFTLSKSSGVVSCDYLDISNSNATGGAKWYTGKHSNNTTNNSGWIFSGLIQNLGILGVG